MFDKLCYTIYLTVLTDDLTLSNTPSNSLSNRERYIMIEENCFSFSDKDLGPDLAAEPVPEGVHWRWVEDRVRSSILRLGVHAVRDHYHEAVLAYEEQQGGCSGAVARDTLRPLVDKLVAEAF